MNISRTSYAIVVDVFFDHFYSDISMTGDLTLTTTTVTIIPNTRILPTTGGVASI